jgi:polysaccharide pyruvyl transferase WcaK-like protein
LRSIRIGLLWHSANSGNLGVGALTVANIAIIRSVAAELDLAPEFLIMGMRDDDPAYVSPEEAARFDVDTRRLISPGGCWARLAAQDCVIDIGGGDSFADIYGPKRFFFLWSTKVMSLLQGRPLLLAPQTIGPFSALPLGWLAGRVLDRAHTVLVRDELSYQSTRKIAPSSNVKLATDVAFALPYEDRSSQRGGEVLQVGVNVSGLLYTEAETGRNRFGLSFDYAEFTDRLMRDLARRSDVQVHLINHVSSLAGGPDDDAHATTKLAAAYPGALKSPRFRSPTEAKSYVSGLDFLVAARMHACIAAFSAGTPVVPIAYSRKFSGLFGTLDYNWLVYPSGRATEDVAPFVLDCLERRAELAQDIVRSSSRIAELVGEYRTCLRSFLSASLAH